MIWRVYGLIAGALIGALVGTGTGIVGGLFGGVAGLGVFTMIGAALGFFAAPDARRLVKGLSARKNTRRRLR
jgi:uncharacterized protein YcfJ